MKYLIIIIMLLLVMGCDSTPAPISKYGVAATSKYKTLTKRLPPGATIIKSLGESTNGVDEYFVVRLLGECFVTDEDFSYGNTAVIKLSTCPSVRNPLTRDTLTIIKQKVDTVYVNESDRKFNF